MKYKLRSCDSIYYQLLRYKSKKSNDLLQMKRHSHVLTFLSGMLAMPDTHYQSANRYRSIIRPTETRFQYALIIWDNPFWSEITRIWYSQDPEKPSGYLTLAYSRRLYLTYYITWYSLLYPCYLKCAQVMPLLVICAIAFSEQRLYCEIAKQMPNTKLKTKKLS